MSQSEGSPTGLNVVSRAGFEWRQSTIALMLVLAPMALAVILTVIGVAVWATWLSLHGAPAELPPPPSIRLYGLLSYAVGSWLAVALAWVWTARQGLRSDVFKFRRLTLPAIAVSIIGFGIVTVGVPIVTHWLTTATGNRSQDIRIDFHDAKSIAIVVFLFVVTTPVTEEILYRGLFVSWLRRVGWQDSNILAFGTVIFAANHIIPLGPVWGAAMILLGLVTYALRLRYESLSPAWLAHALFNAQLTLSYPLIAWYAQAT
ncbi:CPBP family intramembrane metalloprotease [Bradyrhizobium sp. Arg237L]|uniref:CPBP family intramembrane glutamic endopeptidase n=1 Tax=Bradyrhizobium sp. Arg237L TaxID=3003352 RepID=UPI00249DEC3A|nr:CPBP family intramembrane glutamic endopeptidase [Bradyrhizobium sp. Arg237L]MDI4239411.1 CPBP family intramembrane metalloprotease [Bradyrhizobium sp. Arg237L]